MTSTKDFQFSTGQRVQLVEWAAKGTKWIGTVFTVEKVNPRNVNLLAPDGARLVAPREYLEEANAEAVLAADSIEVEPILWPGTVVNVKAREGMYVITHMPDAKGLYRASPLGGAEGRYLRGLPYRNLTVVDTSGWTA